MKHTFKYTLTLILIASISVSCSRKKDKFLNRAWHSVGTEYNLLYNGQIALDKGREGLNQSYFDDYWSVLPVERLEIRDFVTLASQSKNQNFSRAEEKATKAIQKHSMNIGGKEKNPQIDEAYLLLGKARYFDQRFVPAQEAFNYILYKYPTSDKINQAKVWREKTNIRLDNNELAIKNLKRLLRQEDLKGQDLADATSMLAQAYINTKSIDSAVWELETAANNTKSNEERGRYRFIQGQLYNTLGHKDSANIAFNKIIDLHRKTPRIYYISAHLEKIKNADLENGDKLAVYEMLKDLEENRENRPYLDKIYHQVADYYTQNGVDSLAQVYYNKSLRASNKDKKLNARNYDILAQMHFDKSEYKKAGLYYDSTMTNQVKDSKPFRVVKKKRENLEDVIYYEDVAQKSDSILNLVALPEAERLAYFKEYTDKLKAQAEKEAEEARIAEQKAAGFATVNNNLAQNNINASGPNANNASSFYFYNPSTVAYGKNEFRRIWGDRKLKDNWRWSKKIDVIATDTQDVTEVNLEDNEKFSPEFYIEQLPTKKSTIDSIAKERNYAYYQLGLIYKEKFRDFDRSRSKFRALLNNNPEDNLILPSKYNLFKIYEETGENASAELVKNEIISAYPDSRYAAILKNPNLAAEQDANSPESLYNTAFKQFENQEYQQTSNTFKKYIDIYQANGLTPKFELLNASAIGRLKGVDAYLNALKYVALTYANTAEGKEAQNLVDNVVPKLQALKFVDNNKEDGYKSVFEFKNATSTEINDFIKTLNEVLVKVPLFKTKISTDVYNNDTKFVVIHGFRGIATAKTFTDFLLEEDKHKVSRPYFGVSSTNYKTLQIQKNLDQYLNQINNLKN